MRLFTLFRFPGPVLIMVYKLSPELFESGKRESLLLDRRWIMPERTEDTQLFLALQPAGLGMMGVPGGPPPPEAPCCASKNKQIHTKIDVERCIRLRSPWTEIL